MILSSQSAANVKKVTLTQPALEVQETSSQESSLESESDEEDDYMDIWTVKLWAALLQNSQAELWSEISLFNCVAAANRRRFRLHAGFL